MNHSTHVENPDVIIVGSGIMSANLAALLKRLDPKLGIQVYEVTEELAQEASHGWNNAGTGHAGICELSYTPTQNADGTVDVSNAIKIFEQFEKSRQFWAYAIAEGMAENPKEFINPVNHLSFVHGAKWVDYLRARHSAMAAHHFFKEMEFTTEHATIGSWAPLLTEGRADVPIAATKMDTGTDVNFGEISRKLLGWLGRQPGCGIATNHRVTDLDKTSAGWDVTIRDLATGTTRHNTAKFVFVGAGGGSLHLLQKAGIPESKGIGGFPIGGQWLVCDNPTIVARHQAKVYGQPLDAAPTMAVPHLDTRILDGKKTLLFGPFAAWTTKFLHKKGSVLDLPGSVKPHNLATLLKIGASNLDLVKYLVQQGTQSMDDRMEVLHVFYPDAKKEDWKLIDAGIRVQAIKKTDGQAGIVHYGTEVITNEDRTLSALLGASPGASVSVHIVLEVIQKCLPHLLTTEEGKARMKAMIPTYDVDIKKTVNADFFLTQSRRASKLLQLA
ncbi:MAG TPA: malate dehydrogenase (quinone) [Rariglobus sp.]|jgi:malate dehydrogenase (quinone)|nr:malate dehydrogenase (quinone) [Rariglobus sp.]